jgi:hypothetical protein
MEPPRMRMVLTMIAMEMGEAGARERERGCRRRRRTGGEEETGRTGSRLKYQKGMA